MATVDPARERCRSPADHKFEIAILDGSARASRVSGKRWWRTGLSRPSSRPLLDQTGIDVAPSSTGQAAQRVSSWSCGQKVAAPTIARIIALSALLALSIDLAADDPDQKRQLTLETAEFGAVVKVDDPDAAGDAFGVIQVSAKSDLPETRSGELSPAFAHLADVHVDDGKLLVYGGTEDPQLRLLAIHRLDTLKQVELVWGRNLVASPSGRLAVYERFVPGFGSAESTLFGVSLYDTRAVSTKGHAIDAGNAPSAIQPLYRAPDSATRLAPLVTPPWGNARADMSNWTRGPSYTWSRNERHVAFLLTKLLDGETHASAQLAVVSLDASGRPQPAIMVDLERRSEEPYMRMDFAGSSIRLEQRRGDSGKLIRFVDWR